MKKIFAQPEMMVVNLKNNDIVTASDPKYYNTTTDATSGNLDAGRRFDSWEEGF